jgi:hypothetical protein
MKKLQAQLIKTAVKDIIWMARRYADGRQTYASELFNDSYDVLRRELGDEIDNNTVIDRIEYKEVLKYDISIDTSDKHPYAIYGHDMESQSNKDLVNRRFYLPPVEKQFKKPKFI